MMADLEVLGCHYSDGRGAMIRRCADRDLGLILAVINDAAHAYQGVIPEDRWKEPYTSESELRQEIRDGVAFWGYEQKGELAGVMGVQQSQDVTLIRHAYVCTASQHHGIGERLLTHLRAQGP